jgi:hypothetical protein
MKKPEALVQLLEELRGEITDSSVEVLLESQAIVYLRDDSEDKEKEDDGIALTAEECRLLFSKPSIIDRLMEALGDPRGASLALFDITLPGAMLDVLEQRFVAVDEG